MITADEIKDALDETWSPDLIQSGIGTPGIYRNIPFNAYSLIPAANNSTLNLMLKSPAHAQHYKLHGQKETDALVLGNALHAAMLEPESFTDRYCEGIKCDKRTKAGKEADAAFKAEHPDHIILDPDNWRMVLDCSSSVKAHPLAGPWLDRIVPGMTELTVVWNDEATGVLCKARIDAVAEAVIGGQVVKVVVDLKSTKDASRRAFERSIYNYGYHRQAAHYRAGLKANGIDTVAHLIVAFEKERPYATAVYSLKPEAMTAGTEQLQALMVSYKECTESGRWPGYPEQVQDIGLPRWAAYDMENAE